MFASGNATAASSQPAFYDAYKVPSPEDDLGPPSGGARPFAKLPPISARLSAEELSNGGGNNGSGRASGGSGGRNSNGNNYNGRGSTTSGYGRILVDESTISPLLAYTPPSEVSDDGGSNA
jgi:hypothetical protein